MLLADVPQHLAESACGGSLFQIIDLISELETRVAEVQGFARIAKVGRAGEVRRKQDVRS